MFLLSLRTLRFRWRGFVATFIALLVCGAIMTAAGSMMETGVRAVMPAERLAAAPIVVTGDNAYKEHNNPVASLAEQVPVEESLVDEVQNVPGVAKAVADTWFPAVALRDGKPVTGKDDESFGHGWASAQLMPYKLSSGTAPKAAGEVVVDPDVAREAGVKAGDSIEIAAAGATKTYKVSGIADPSRKLDRQAIFFSPADTQQLIPEPGKVEAIGVFLEPGADVAATKKKIAAQTGEGISVLTGDDRGAAERSDIDMTDLVLVPGLLGGLAIMAGLLGVASTLSLSFQQRHREVALLRAIGGTPAQLRRMIVGETLVVAVIATAIAMVPGRDAGEFIFDRLVTIGIAPEGVTYYRGWTPVIIAGIVAVLTSVGAAVIASRRVVKTRAVEALGDDEGQQFKLGKVRLTFAILCFVLAASCVYSAFNFVTGPFIATPATWASILFAVGLALLGPSITKGMTRLIGPFVRAGSGVPGQLASLNARARAVRMAAVITPVMLLTGIATANLYLIATESSVSSVYTENLKSDVVLKAGQDGFAPGTVDKVRALDEVGAASEFVASSGFIEKPEDPWKNKDLAGWQLLGFNGESAAAVGGATAVKGNLSDLTGKSIAIADTFAKEFKGTVGDTMTVRMGDGAKETLKIVAVVKAKESFESLIVPADLLAKHTTKALPTHIVTVPKKGVSEAAATAALGKLTAGLPGAEIVDRKEMTKAFNHHLGAQAMVSYMMIGTLFGYITISVLNSLWLAVSRRSREFGLQRLTGATKAQIMRMMAIEGGITAVIGIALGSLVAPATFVTFSKARAGDLIPAGSPWLYVGMVAFALVLTMGATLLPTWRALKNSPLEAAVLAA
ncbi:FtsX-like permease family protein [Streptomyces monticola]|uniref:FtsX-like permease family protein n=1 Tax=Streptomyces monticola TaxID=2666263 RepID=A0ABW2JWB2_9ACTN